VLFSDGFRLFRHSGRVMGPLGRLVDLANRSSVVIYTIDARGLATRAFTAADNMNIPGAGGDVDFDKTRASRRQQLQETQEGLRSLAEETGGLFLRQNDISRSLGRVLEDQRGYYLIGYVPDPAVFKASGGRPAFHKLKVRVKRPGLQVRSRTGFYGVTDDARVAAQTKAESLLTALVSPFTTGDIHLRLASLFLHDGQQGSFVRSFLEVDPRDLNLEDGPDGSRRARLDVLALTYGDNGVVVDQASRAQEIVLTPEHLEAVIERGLVYTIDVPVKRPGGYQLRVAVRDVASGRVGSANQFVEVPDLKKRHLALSGIMVSGEQEGDTATGAVRRFRPGSSLTYRFMIYNARFDQGSGRPKLEAQMQLFRDGQPLAVGEVRPVEPGEQTDKTAVTTGGGLLLGPEMPPGDYVLQVSVTDTLADSKRRTATQAIDFEVKP